MGENLREKMERVTKEVEWVEESLITYGKCEAMYSTLILKGIKGDAFKLHLLLRIINS